MRSVKARDITSHPSLRMSFYGLDEHISFEEEWGFAEGHQKVIFNAIERIAEASRSSSLFRLGEVEKAPSRTSERVSHVDLCI